MKDVTALLRRALEQYRSGKLERAERAYREVLAIDPGQAEAWHRLGMVRHRMGKSEEAVSPLREAVARKPCEPVFHHQLGIVQHSLGKLDEAVGSLRRAVDLGPRDAAAFNDLGVALAAQGKLDEALDALRHAVGLEPGFADAQSNLGNTLRRMNRLEEAVAALEQALLLDPNHFQACINLGLAFGSQGKLAAAVARLRSAVGLRPDDARARLRLGSALAALGEPVEAAAELRRALELAPDDPEAHVNLGMTLLVLGDFDAGWSEYEWRWKGRRRPGSPCELPLWDGGPLEGRTILLRAEQGIGDALQFVRYATLVARRGGRVVLEAPRPVLPILGTCSGIERLVPAGAKVADAEIQAPLLSLPRIFGTRMDTIPANVPYLFPDPARVERGREDLGQGADLKIGVCWRGNPRYGWDRFRSFPLTCLEPVARLDGVRLFSLQKGPGTEELRAVGKVFPITDLGTRLDEGGAAFLDTAAAMKNLDLVITPDTALAHLAGALGVPVWVALFFVADWRWLRDREDSPWYPTMRLFRQSEAGHWSPVFERMAEEAARL